jgi:hypothetical protein
MIKKLLESKNIPVKQLTEDAKSFKVLFSSQLAFERAKHAIKNAGYEIRLETRTVAGYAIVGTKYINKEV